MEKLYREVSDKLLEGLKKYLKGEIQYEQLEKLSLRENLVYNNNKWNEIIEEKSKKIVEIYRGIYDEILKVDEYVKKAEDMDKGDTFEVDLEGIKAHAEILGRNSVQPIGNENSAWYYPPFPSITMISALNDNENEKNIESESISED